MDSYRLWRPVKGLVLLLLFGYFVTKIIESSTKLQKREIGVSLERIREELVEESSYDVMMILICFINVIKDISYSTRQYQSASKMKEKIDTI